MLIALDMDGTTLNEEGQISPENKEAILHAQSLGHIVIIATGRSYMDAERQLRLAGLNCPVVSLNGALVTLPDQTLAASIPMNKEDIIPALLWMNEVPGLYYEVYTKDNVYVELNKRVEMEKLATLNEDEVEEEFRWLLKAMVEMQFQQAAVSYVENMEEIWSKEDNLIYKTLVFSLNRELLKEASLRFSAIPGLIITASHSSNIEINHKNANKGTGVAMVAKHYGIPAAQIAVMGDSYNDLPMFEMAGYRIAMENAAPILKETADFITLNHKEHGVAAGIRHLLDKQ
ncbi:Cof-type HAD-IIB family hydrolase [Paenibacillus sp. MMS20-IR301]|uniref:Cof-type HAD-IIB family hydrolase n=1 Tax=Paenibacillus sp. MMS20-IR301 TaxID=2895946 RepID=UPI0028E3BEEC|nr:Cof-type HAD-IIB family hydrolase [Paenibacillus sp. MMS20-IR301]WNS41909.1 Cof-type HAD-IIB family hydrolase [Paenibacillus sp. MMS20-IR301]